MPRRIHLEPHLLVGELERRFRGAREPYERSWFQILWLLAKGQTEREIAESTDYSRYWIGQVARRYNQEGPTGMYNRRYTHSHRAQPLLSPEQLADLAEAVRGPAPEGDEWLGRTVAEWMSAAGSAGERAVGLGVLGAARRQAPSPPTCAGRSRSAGRLQKS